MKKQFTALFCAGVMAASLMTVTAFADDTGSVEGIQASPEFYAEADLSVLDGKKIGITGVSPRLAGLVAHVNYGNAKYIRPSEAVNKVTKYLHDVKKCDVIICISHLGWDILGSDNKEFIPETHYIDYVVGGHSHTYFTEPLYVKDADGKEVPDFQMGKSGRWVAKSVLEVE